MNQVDYLEKLSTKKTEHHNTGDTTMNNAIEIVRAAWVAVDATRAAHRAACVVARAADAAAVISTMPTEPCYDCPGLSAIDGGFDCNDCNQKGN